ncbi:MAG: helix-turn-helix domain-containing protein [Acidobacteria bacterium]|nr:helix-turn-helix domain-containing protein [Acidobacteriota bacterium]
MIRAEDVPRVNQDLMESWQIAVRGRHAEEGLEIWDLDLPGELRAPAHEHLRSFFCILLDGWMENDYGRRRIPFHPFLTVFHPAGTVHTTVGARRGGRVLTLEVSREWERRVEGLVTLPETPVAIPFDDGAWLARRLLREMAAPEACSTLVFEGITLELLASAGRAARAERTAPVWLTRAIDHAHDRFAGGLTLHEVALDLGVHPARLSSEFRRYTGRTFGDYVRELRVGFVKGRLANGDSPLADIALQAGFADQAHCTRVFKAATGWTPGRYRVALRRETRSGA